MAKIGSSGRTRTYNPPVNSCTNGKTDNYRQLRLILKISLLRYFQKRLSAAYFEGGSLKKSPKYFRAFLVLALKTPLQSSHDKTKTRCAVLPTPTRR